MLKQIKDSRNFQKKKLNRLGLACLLGQQRGLLYI
ncbi:hypothetical protein B0I21_101570 [Sphingobacterium paludis]|uniref:Uncharacterized protein n=1 Tax=Sphingobacterium paludis TaxID=1476465 RepID=A0A4R7D8V9_9SPHI|nr:hypothetical protein B0I21_101570 [Sphingobacterium paludis]